MPRFFASSAFIANAYVLFAGDMLSHTMSLAASTSLIFLYGASAESNLSVILLNTASAGAGVLPVDVDLAVLERAAHGRAAHARLAVGREALRLQERDGHRRHDLLLGERLAADHDGLRRDRRREHHRPHEHYRLAHCFLLL
jgi:hypothetical protein